MSQAEQKRVSDSRLPNKIEPCPILEAILEIRYESNIPGEARFGVIYNEFRGDFPRSEKQPVLQIPDSIRTADSNLRHLPEYKLIGDNFILLTGQTSFGIATSGEYCGWHVLSDKIRSVLERLEKLDFIDSITRLGLRYINVFNFDILENSTLKIMRGETPLESNGMQFKAQIAAGNYEHTLQVANRAAVKSSGKEVGESIIDIDTVASQDLSDFSDRREELIEGAHQEEKKLFFSLLGDSYLKSLNPQY